MREIALSDRAGGPEIVNRLMFSGGKSPVVAVLCLFLIYGQPALAWTWTRNQPPTISGTPPTSVNVGDAYVFQPTASDPEGRKLSFGVRNRPSWAVFNSSTGRLSGTPTVVGTYSNIRISVSDGKYWISLPVFSITVATAAAPAPPVNHPPVITGAPAASVTVGQAYDFTPTASDPDGQTLTFNIANKPAWAKFSYASGRLSGTPASGDVSTYSNISISVTDGMATTSLAGFAITVQTGNRPPVISGTPPGSVTVGQVYDFTPTASDPDGQALGFAISNKPSWATFNTGTGRLSGTPTSSDVANYSNIGIAVSDGTLTASLANFSITVQAAANHPPVISGTPVKSATVGQPYSFKPAASDADGDPLTFSIQGMPGWASFDSSSGTLYGTPASTDAGTTSSNIVISVSDGKASASLPAFAISVAATQTASVTLSWVAPTTNTDGTPLTNLAGYRVFYGTTSGQYTQTLSVPSPGITSIVVEGLSTGRTWYFATKAVNSSGGESDYSQEVSKSFP
jgi:hypothetical protein